MPFSATAMKRAQQPAHAATLWCVKSTIALGKVTCLEHPDGAKHGIVLQTLRVPERPDGRPRPVSGHPTPAALLTHERTVLLLLQLLT